MPNYCDNRIEIRGDAHKIQKMLADIDVASGELDFHKIVPRPIELEITKGSMVINGLAILQGDWEDWFKRSEWRTDKFLSIFGKLPESREECIEMIESIHLMPEARGCGEDIFGTSLREARIAIQNLKVYGFMDWYDWSIVNWGTKWNGGPCTVTADRDDFVSLSFQTAWSPPLPIAEALYEKYGEDGEGLSIRMIYGESGCWFAGEFKDGSTSDCEDDDVKSFLETEFGYQFEEEDSDD